VAVQEVRDGVHTLDPAQAQSPTIAVIGASSTIGSIVVNMLAGRGEKVVGVCSAGNAGPVLRNGAVTVLDRKKGGLELKADMKLDIVIDCVGGSAIEEAGKAALDGKGHFISIIGPGEGTFGEGTDGATKNMVNGLNIASRSMMSMFSKIKYTLARAPISGASLDFGVLAELVKEGVLPILDSEVEMSNEENVKAAIEKVREHKNSGRLVFTNN